MDNNRCKINNEDCSAQGKHHGRGYCRTHYQRWKKHGDPHEVKSAPIPPALSGSDNPNWKGDQVSYQGRHDRVYRERGKASEHACADCGEPASHWSQSHCTDGLDVWQHYTPRCQRCHGVYDGQWAWPLYWSE